MPLSGRPLEAPVQIPHLLRAGLGQSPDNMALVSTATRCTWRDLERASDNLAGNLLGLGLSPGDRVASLMPNRAALIIHYIACMKSGLVSVPLNYRFTILEINRALVVSEASVLLAHAERGRELAGSPAVRDLPHGLIFYDPQKERRPSFWDLIATPPARKERPVPKASDPAFIFFTSGSTGPAKGVTHSYETVGWMLATGGNRSFRAISGGSGVQQLQFSMRPIGKPLIRRDFSALTARNCTQSTNTPDMASAAVSA